MNKKDIEFLKKSLANPRRIAILVHYNPDGDAIGSALALSEYLRTNKHDVNICSPNIYPDFLQWMPEIEQVKVATTEMDVCIEKITQAELIFCVDFNTPSRIGVLQPYLENAKGIKVLIDHHMLPSPDFDIIYSVSENMSSTAELIYNFLIYKLEEKNSITKTMADCLYVGIITDTGSLSYACNSLETYDIIGKLVALGVDGEDIHRKIYDNYSENRIRLLGFCLSERLVVLNEFAASYIYLTKEDLKRFSYKHGDTEGFVNYGLSMKGINFTAFFMEREDRVRVSFRSRNGFSANKYARTYFEGGGHKYAAGGDSFRNMKDTVAYFEKMLKEYIAQQP